MSPLLLLLLLAIALPLKPATAQPAPAPASAAPVKEDDVRCLRGVKQDLKDPKGRLSSWTFANTSAGAICGFPGVTCWHPQESRVLAIELSGFGLQGAVPSPLKYCLSTTTLDLSNNSLSGPIPPALCDWLPFLVSLDLSGNRLSGPIPSELSNCTFLNSLKLNGNALSGLIPASLSRLVRLTSLDLSDNRLEGEVPPQLGAAFPRNHSPGTQGRPWGRARGAAALGPKKIGAPPNMCTYMSYYDLDAWLTAQRHYNSCQRRKKGLILGRPSTAHSHTEAEFKYGPFSWLMPSHKENTSDTVRLDRKLCLSPVLPHWFVSPPRH